MILLWRLAGIARRHLRMWLDKAFARRTAVLPSAVVTTMTTIDNLTSSCSSHHRTARRELQFPQEESIVIFRAIICTTQCCLTDASFSFHINDT